MPRTFIDEYGMTCIEPTDVEQAEYDTAKAKEEVERATNEMDKTMSKIEIASERLQILIENNDVKAATQSVFDSIIDVLGARYNMTCFRGKPYSERHWQGVETEKSFLVSAIESWNSKYEYLFTNLKRLEEYYKEQEQNYNQLAGKTLSQTTTAFADRSMSTEAREAADIRLAKVQKLVSNFRKSEEEQKAAAAREAELDKYRLHRRTFEEVKDPIPKEDQEKYNAIQAEAKAILEKIDAESEDFKNPIQLRMKERTCEELAYAAQEESDSKEFVEDNKDKMADAGFDIKDFEGKTPEEVISQKWKELTEKMEANKARRRELYEQWNHVQMRTRKELWGYYMELERAVPGFEGAVDLLMERDY